MSAPADKRDPDILSQKWTKYPPWGSSADLTEKIQSLDSWKIICNSMIVMSVFFYMQEIMKLLKPMWSKCLANICENALWPTVVVVLQQVY